MRDDRSNLHLWFIAGWLGYGLLRLIQKVGLFPVACAGMLALAGWWAIGQGLLSPEGSD